jgi:methionyl-tRNA formyltransferase
MRSIVIGAVESTRVCLKVSRSSSAADVQAVVTLTPELAHRHSDFVDLGAEAAACGARLIHVSNCNDPAVVEALKSLRPDYLFVIGWSQIAGAALRAVPRVGAIGFHPAPLPRMRGRAVIPWTILLDEKITGSTMFWLDDGIDSGPILAQRFLHVAADETASSLYARHIEALEAILAEVLPHLATGETRSMPQDERYTTWCGKRVPEDGIIDWNQSMEMVWRLIRAVTRPYPGAFTYYRDERMILWSAQPWINNSYHVALPGQVVARSETGFAVRCGDGRDLWIACFSHADGSVMAPPRLHARFTPRV